MPEVAVVGTASTVLWVGVLVAAGWLSTPLGLGGAALVTLVSLGLLRSLAPTPDRTQTLCAAVAVLGAGLWVVVNAPLVSEHVFVDRDPSVFTLSATWLVDNVSPAIDPGAGEWDGPGFEAGADGLVRVQNSHVVPGVAALLGRAAGPSAVLKANVLVGAVALLACFAVARRWVAAPWALLAPLVLGLGLPFLAVTRGLYTEPTVTVLALGAVAVLAASPRGDLRALVVAGAMAGGAGMVRIDGLLVTALLVPCVALTVPAGGRPGRARPRVLLVAGRVGAFTGAALLVAAVGLIDLVRFSTPDYLETYDSIAVEGVALILASAALSAAVVSLAPAARDSVPGRRVARGLAVVRGWPTPVVVLSSAVLVGAAAAPLWLEGHQVDRWPSLEYVEAIASMQEALGLPVDGTRSYNEFALTAMTWYHGWALLLLGGAGVVGAAVVGLRERSALVVLPAGVLPLVVLYTWDLHITPDQVWASRRMVAFVLPLLAVAAAWACAWLWRGGRVPRSVAVAGAVALVVSPVTTLAPVAGVAQDRGALGQAYRLCELVGDRPVVVAGKRQTIAPTVAVVCGSQVTVADRVDIEDTGRWADELGPDVLIITTDLAAVHWSAFPERPNVEVEMVGWERQLLSEPRGLERRVLPVFLGEITPDQAVEPMS